MKLLNYFGGAVVGLAAFSAIGGYFGWLEAFWWGGKGLFYPLGGALLLISIGVPGFFHLTHLLRKRQLSGTYLHFAVAGFAQGSAGVFAALIASMYILASLNAEPSTGLLLTLLSATFTVAVAFINLGCATLLKVQTSATR